MYNATNAATWLRSPPRIALRCNSTQRFVCYNATNAATWLTAPQRLATRLRVLRRASIQLNDLFVNLLSHRHAAFRSAPFCSTALRLSTQRFVYFFSRLNSQRLGSPRRGTPQRNDLFITSRLHATSLNPTPRSAFQRNELKLN